MQHSHSGSTAGSLKSGISRACCKLSWGYLASTHSRYQLHHVIISVKLGSTYYAICPSEEDSGTRHTSAKHYVYFVDAVADDDVEIWLSLL